MKIVFTIHVKDKLQEQDAISLGINGKKIRETIRNPIVVDRKPEENHSVGQLNDKLSLSVIWKIENKAIKVITFYPARKGRYENKILQRR